MVNGKKLLTAITLVIDMIVYLYFQFQQNIHELIKGILFLFF